MKKRNRTRCNNCNKTIYVFRVTNEKMYCSKKCFLKQQTKKYWKGK